MIRTCDECATADDQPRHIEYGPTGETRSVCFSCATSLGVHDYSDLLSAATAANQTTLEYVLSQNGE